MCINLIVTLVVSLFTAPPAHIQALVEDLRSPDIEPGSSVPAVH
ncbi:Na+/solute symporter [Calothrix sp. NIES-4071]|nr:Na+/solute symporter [Calothrix sp. NIES-4071]BAZ57359.1 Na+/solute symporter [Calothrix sp. NIES-4105]